MLALLGTLDVRMGELQETEQKLRAMDEKMEKNLAKLENKITLNLRGKHFQTCRDTLLTMKNTYFCCLLASGNWLPDSDGSYFVDVRSEGFERILHYLSSGSLSMSGLTEYEMECVYQNLHYFQIPFEMELNYTLCSKLDGFRMTSSAFELPDGRLCGNTADNGVVVWNMETGSVEMTLTAHTSSIEKVIALPDGRICSCSSDTTIKIWNPDSRECELSWEAHSYGVNCIIALVDGRVCSCYGGIKIWSIATGKCELAITCYIDVRAVIQLRDGRVCSGDASGVLRIWSIVSGACELTLERHSSSVSSLACIDDHRVASGSLDAGVKVWNIPLGVCLVDLDGHNSSVWCVIRLHDGRVCSGSIDGNIKIWNATTGVCEKSLGGKGGGLRGLLQLSDGRLVSSVSNDFANIWT